MSDERNPLDVRLLQAARQATASEARPVKTVILAGGKGARLKPYTAVLPKPLMPLGDRAILEIVIRQLARQGLVDITLSVGHLAHVIEAVFGDGRDHNVELTYVREDAPLGTAGSLRLVTTFDFRELVKHHRASGNLLTIATRKRRVDVDYGVLTVEPGNEIGSQVVGFTEKPQLEFTVSMGIYVLEPAALNLIPPEGYFDFPDLVRNALRANAPVGAFEYDGLWLDIGRQADYDEAIRMVEEGKLAVEGDFDRAVATPPARHDDDLRRLAAS